MATKRTTPKDEKDQPQQAQAKSGAASAGRGKKDDGERKAGSQLDSEAETETGMLDVHYNLVSVLYHALQGAALYTEYAEDAEAEGDAELAEFFSDIQDEERDRAERAKEYLLARLSGSMGESADDDDEEEAASAPV